jgi:hypothetical protein
MVACSQKRLVHNGPIVMRGLVCTRTPEPVCTCEFPVLAFDAKNGADEILCQKGK